MRMSHLLQIKHQIVITLLIVMCCTSYVRADSQVKKIKGGLPAPEFELQDMQGKYHQLKAYAGQTMIVNFWAVWCAPCRKEIPAMNRALAILKDENITILGINVGDQQEMIEAFSKDYPMDFTVLMDTNGAVSQHWQVTGFPTTFIINPQGQVVYRVVGDREWDEISMLDSIRSVATNLAKANTTKF